MHRLLILGLACGLANCIEYGENSHEEPNYSYEFAVHDPSTGHLHSRKEERKGGSAQGEYSVVDADGSKRRVQYSVRGKEEYAGQLDQGGTGYKSPGSLQPYYKSVSNYEGGSSQKPAGFLESLPALTGYKPSYESSYKSQQQSYQTSYNAPQPNYNAPQPSYNAPQPSYNAPLSSYVPSYKIPLPSQPIYNAPLPSYQPSYQNPLPNYISNNQLSYSGKSNYESPLLNFKPKYRAPENRPFVPIVEPGNKPDVPSSVFTPALVTYQPTERAGYTPFLSTQPAVPSYQTDEQGLQYGLPGYQNGIANYQNGIPNYQNGIPNYQNGIPNYQSGVQNYQTDVQNYQSSVQSYQSGAPSYQSSVQSYQSGAPSYQQKPVLSDYKPSSPSYRSAEPSYESSNKAGSPNYAPALSYKSSYGEGTATSSVSFSTKGALVKTSTKHILPPKKDY